MTEAELRVLVGNGFTRLHRKGHISWIESHATAAGFPDADMCADGQIAQVELKIVKDKGKIEVRPTQYRWMRERVKAGSHPVLLMGSDTGFYVLHGNNVSKPSALTSVDQIKGRPHFVTSTIDAAINAAFLIAKYGVDVCPNN